MAREYGDSGAAGQRRSARGTLQSALPAGYTVAMDLILAILIGAALLAAVFALIRGRSPARLPVPEAGPPAAGEIQPGRCPLCGSFLAKGERIKSDVFPGAGDRIMRIFGCPHCWPSTTRMKRICPVCGFELPPEGWAVARLFERPGRMHVHVLGCTACRENRR